MWAVYALLSAFFAALTSILAQIGIDNINSNLATAIRTVVVLILSWGIVFIMGKQNDIVNIGQKNWIFLIRRRGSYSGACPGYLHFIRDCDRTFLAVLL
jgi:transporter family protein